MAKANIKIGPMQAGQEDEFIQLYCTTFARPEADMIMPMMYPMGLDHPQVRARIKASFMASNRSDTRFCARDAETGELLGVSWWQVTREPASTAEAVDAELERTLHSQRQMPDVEGMNKELASAYLKAAFYQTYEITQSQPFVELRILAVHPHHQGRGIGAKLIKDGLKRADELRLPVFVISAVQGKPVYERYGFDEVKELRLDCRDYGGQSAGTHWTMLRASHS